MKPYPYDYDSLIAQARAESPQREEQIRTYLPRVQPALSAADEAWALGVAEDYHGKRAAK